MTSNAAQSLQQTRPAFKDAAFVAKNTSKNGIKVPSTRLDSLQILRGLAALLVCAGHILSERGRLDPQAFSLYDAFPWGIGVDIFFIISGIIMIWTFGDKFGRDGATTEFLRRRLIRIVPSYWFFTALLALGLLISPKHVDSTSLEASHLVLSLLFVPHFDPEGTLRPLLNLGWTLVYEMFFYAVFSVGLLFRKHVGLPIIIASIALAPVLGFHLPTQSAVAEFLSNSILLEFIIGIVMAETLRDRRPSLHWVMGWVVVAVTAGVIANSIGFADVRFVSRGLPALMCVAAVMFIFRSSTNRFVVGLIVIGDASYGLYLSHPFVIEATKIMLSSKSIEEGLYISTVTAIFVTASLFSCIVFSVLYYYYLEQPFSVLLNKLSMPPGLRSQALTFGRLDYWLKSDK